MRLFRRKERSTGRQRLGQGENPIRLGKKFSYRSRRSDIEINVGRDVQRELVKKEPHNRFYWLQRLGLIILLTAVVASIVNVLTLSTHPKVQSLNSDQANTFLRDLSEYETSAQKILAGSFWNRNKITVDSKQISRNLISEFPELDGASMNVPLLAHRPIIYLQPAEPVLIVSAKNGAFVVADNGKALLRSSKIDDFKKYNLPTLTDQSGIVLRVGRQALTTSNVRFIQTIITQLANKQYKVTSMDLPAASSELDVHLADQTYIVKFNLQNEAKARQQAGTFLSTIAYLKKQNTPPTKYVDVRVDGRVYYQ